MTAIVTAAAAAALMAWAGVAAAQGVVTVLPAPGTVPAVPPPPTTVLHSPYEEVPSRPGTTEPPVEVGQTLPAAGQPAALQPLPAQPSPQQSAVPESSTPWPADGNAGPTTQALNALEGAGYGVFTDFRAKGNGYEATVEVNGRPRNVYIDPGSGSVTPEN